MASCRPVSGRARVRRRLFAMLPNQAEEYRGRFVEGAVFCTNTRVQQLSSKLGSTCSGRI